MPHKLKVICGVSCLMAGAFIYLAWRPLQTLGFRITDMLGAEDLVSALRAALAQSQPSDFVIYNLPGGLWSLAYILLADSMADTTSIRTRIVVAALIPAIGIISELLQAVEWCPGWYDPIDIICYTAPYLIYTTIIIWNRQT